MTIYENAEIGPQRVMPSSVGKINAENNGG